MHIKAHIDNVRIAPRKVRLVAGLLRGKDVAFSLVQLQLSGKRCATLLTKLVKSAIANAQHNFKIQPDDLYISELTVDQGPTLKRFRPRAMGRAGKIRKKTSHIHLTLQSRSGLINAVSAKVSESQPILDVDPSSITTTS